MKGYRKSRSGVLARLLPQVRVDRETGCWNWGGYITPAGYGQCFDGTHRNAFAHRVFYEQLIGAVPPGGELDHLCRNTKCCNPTHLEPVTQTENVLRGVGFAGIQAATTECPKGHPYDAENTYWRPDRKGRDCRKCRATRGSKGRRSGGVAADGTALREVRVARGWTQKQLAYAAGVERSVLQRIEANQRTQVDPNVLEVLADIAGIPLEVFTRHAAAVKRSEGAA